MVYDMLNMMSALVTFYNIIYIILGASALIAVAAYFHERQKYQKLVNDNPNQVIKQAEQESANILHKALQRAQNILSKAEDEGVEKVKELEGEYESKISTELSQAEAAFVKYLESLRAKGYQLQAISQQAIDNEARQMFQRLEEKLTSSLQTTQAQSAVAIENELKNMRQMINNYKLQQLALIDENIVAMLEKTISLVLSKRISLEDELDLIYRALDKAKTEKFIM